MSEVMTVLAGVGIKFLASGVTLLAGSCVSGGSDELSSSTIGMSTESPTPEGG